MVDLHCHILHGLDDGAKSLEESLAMAENAKHGLDQAEKNLRETRQRLGLEPPGPAPEPLPS